MSYLDISLCRLNEYSDQETISSSREFDRNSREASIASSSRDMLRSSREESIASSSRDMARSSREASIASSSRDMARSSREASTASSQEMTRTNRAASSQEMARNNREANSPGSSSREAALSSREASIVSSRDFGRSSREVSYPSDDYPDGDSRVGSRPSVRREASRLGREASFLSSREASYPDARLPNYLGSRQLSTGYLFAGREGNGYLEAGSYLGSGGSNYGTLETMSARSFGYMVPQPPPTTHWQHEAPPR